jgi:hypothetical protein
MEINTKNIRHVRSLLSLLDYAYDRIQFEDEIEETGYNEHTGYVYIVLDGLCLGLFEGRTEGIVVFAYDQETGEEIEYDSIEEYYNQLKK